MGPWARGPQLCGWKNQGKKPDILSHFTRGVVNLTHFIFVFHYYQGRQSIPKSGRSEWGGERNFGVDQTTAPKNLLLKGYFCLEQRLPALNFRGGAEKW